MSLIGAFAALQMGWRMLDAADASGKLSKLAVDRAKAKEINRRLSLGHKMVSPGWVVMVREGVDGGVYFLPEGDFRKAAEELHFEITRLVVDERSLALYEAPEDRAAAQAAYEGNLEHIRGILRDKCIPLGMLPFHPETHRDELAQRGRLIR